MPSKSSSFTVRAGAIVIAALATVSMPQPAVGQPNAFRTPQFAATAVSFKALQETHWNWTGSDEVFGIFYDFMGIGINKTPAFGDVDAGETRNFSAPSSCISVQPACDRGPSSLAFGVALVEEDYSFAGFCHGALDTSGPPPTPEEYEKAFDDYNGTCPGDDLIGKTKVKLTQDELLAALPTVGASFDRTVRLTGGDGTYEVTYRVTRLANAINIPPIGPAVVVNAISLEATVSQFGFQKNVTLTWSGATTPNVDIYRNGSVITTTPNDGNYVEQVAAGTYQYRVCDAGSTTVCSAVVTAVVT